MSKKLTLTFDNGPEAGATDYVLDILKRRSLKVFFFVIGQKAARPEGQKLLRRMVEEGHVVGNHTMTHSLPLGLGSSGFAKNEVLQAEAAISSFASDPPLFRPYAGKGVLGPHLLKTDVVEVLQRKGYSVALWNSVPRDWEEPFDGWVERGLADIDANDWTVMVLHDVRRLAMAHLEEFLDEVARRDVQLVQALPDSCLPMKGGIAREALSSLVGA